MKPISYMVDYCDFPGDKVRHFGPYPSETVAQFFKASLPMPEKGGWCRISVVQPFTAQEGHTVSQLIARERRERQQQTA